MSTTDEPTEYPERRVADRREGRAELVAALGLMQLTIQQFIDATRALTSTLVEAVESEGVRARVWQKIVTALVVLLLVLVVINLSVLRENKANGDAIRSCSEPEGECFKETQAAAQRSIDAIVAQVRADMAAEANRLRIQIECDQDPVQCPAGYTPSPIPPPTSTTTPAAP